MANDLTSAEHLLINQLVMYKTRFKAFTLNEAATDTGKSINTIRAWEQGEVDSFIIVSYYYSKIIVLLDDDEADVLRWSVLDTMRRATRQRFFDRIDPDGEIRRGIKNGFIIEE